MPIQVPCPGCQTLLRLNDEFIGKTVACPKCRTQFPALANDESLPSDDSDLGNSESNETSVNPYAPSASAPVLPSQGDVDFDIPEKDLAKIEAVIKDARQVALAILLCFFCSGVGFVLIGPWYAIRLIQWGNWSRKYPTLASSDAPKGSLPKRFHGAKIRLIIGLVVGGLLFVLAALFFLAALPGSRAAAAGLP